MSQQAAKDRMLGVLLLASMIAGLIAGISARILKYSLRTEPPDATSACTARVFKSVAAATPATAVVAATWGRRMKPLDH